MKYKLALSGKGFCRYDLVQSSRAKYIRIKISPEGEVKVVVPQQVNNKLAHDFVQQRKDWIDKTLQEIKKTPVPEVLIPKQLDLQFINESWEIDYSSTDYKGVVLTPESEKLCLGLEGMIKDKELIFNVLEKWLKIKAKQTFPEVLAALATEHGFAYNRVTIRGQKTRWGSCSSKQNINLNYKLLFFPDEVVRYVFIHELCHTQEMNHSTRFWNLVERCDPAYQQHRQVLKKAEKFVPFGF